jgi:hypothetical protein
MGESNNQAVLGVEDFLYFFILILILILISKF